MSKMLSAAALAAALSAAPVAAQTPEPRSGVFLARDFRFHAGETLPEVKLAYKTLGDPNNEAVLVLHGTAGSSANMLARGFAGEMFGDGQPLDAKKYFIILPDALGAGASSKPSDGLKAKFPAYNYDDMVDAQRRLVVEGLGVKHLRAVIGNSMGGMHAWLWGVRYPDMADLLIPMASQPTAMSSRNWMLRRLMIETIKADPDYKDGFYETQPKMTRLANAFYGAATNGGELAYYRLAPNRAAADKLVEERLKAPFAMDANDFIYQWQASADYDPEPRLGEIRASVLAINSSDDERNPLATGVMETALKKIKSARLYVIPGSPETGGHGTTGSMAKLFAAEVAKAMASAPRLP